VYTSSSQLLLRLTPPHTHTHTHTQPILSSEEEETYTAAAVGHIYQFVKHNARYSSQEEGERRTDFNITGGVLVCMYYVQTHTIPFSPLSSSLLSFSHNYTHTQKQQHLARDTHTHTYTLSEVFLQDGSGLSGVSGVGVLPQAHTHTHAQTDRFRCVFVFVSVCLFVM
jgi:hypothetical protein